MAINPLPPQAYTKEILLKAYQWLQQQPANIREMATHPDILVSLFLKADRDGDFSLDRPSIQNFKSELKNLAGMIGELDKNESVKAKPTPPLPQIQNPAPPTLQPFHTNEKNLLADQKTSELIRETALSFNLSSDQEALRMLVKLGYQRVKKLIEENR
jgi:hypothetical protein